MKLFKIFLQIAAAVFLAWAVIGVWMLFDGMEMLEKRADALYREITIVEDRRAADDRATRESIDALVNEIGKTRAEFRKKGGEK